VVSPNHRMSFLTGPAEGRMRVYGLGGGNRRATTRGLSRIVMDITVHGPNICENPMPVIQTQCIGRRWQSGALFVRPIPQDQGSLQILRRLSTTRTKGAARSCL
jgi:hypothetical protein